MTMGQAALGLLTVSGMASTATVATEGPASVAGQGALTVAWITLIMAIPTTITLIVTKWGEKNQNTQKIEILKERADFADEKAKSMADELVKSNAEAAAARTRADAAERRADEAQRQADDARKRADEAHAAAAALKTSVVANQQWATDAHQMSPTRTPPPPPPMPTTNPDLPTLSGSGITPTPRA